MKALAAAAVLVVLAGCSRVSGLRPVEPPLPFLRAVFPEVPTVRPTLQWEPFVPPVNGWTSRIRDVTYDLRVWRVEGEAPAELVYARQGLLTPYHRIEIRLMASTRYMWSVRARFNLDGAIRVTEWGTEREGSRLPQVPNPFYYRFATP